MFVDEVGASLKGVVGTTWSPKGQTPTVQHCCNWKKLSTIGAITPNGQIIEQTYEHSICSEQVIAFLRHLTQSVPGKLLVIWDGAAIHRAKAVKAYLTSEAGQPISVLSLPAYAPECNPIEWLWAWLKKNCLANLCVKTLQELKSVWSKALEAARSRTDLVRSFFTASAVAGVGQLP